MSRKTRKLIWSVPLVAVFAVVGALAIFAVQAPQGAQAQSVEVPGSVEGLKATAKSRNSIELTWGLPQSGDAPTSYRIDHSSDNLVWERFVENTDSGDTANRSYLVTDDVDTDTRSHYRVFAINEAGTGPVSNNPVTAFVAVADTFPATTPIASTLVLTLSIDPADSNTVVLNWTKPTTRGAAITGYTVVEMVDEATPDLSTPRTACLSDNGCLRQDITDADTTTTKHADLITGTQHYYRVTASSTNQDDVHSNVVGITLGNVVNPTAPTSLLAVPLTGNDVELYWIGPSSDGGHTLATVPIVEGRTRADSNVGWEDWSTVTGSPGVAANAYNFLIDGEVDGQWQYRVRVEQNDSPADSGLDKMSSWSRTSNRITLPLSTTQNRVPLAAELTASELVVETRREQGIRLTWEFDDTADTTEFNTPSNYRIDRSKDGMVWEVAQRDTVQLAEWDDKGTNGLAADADTADDWHYRLFPINGSTYGQADYDADDVRPADIPPSSLVFGLTATGISTTSIKLDWTRPAAAHDGFDLYMAMPDPGSGGLPFTTGGGEYAMNELDIPSNVTTYTHDKGLGPEQKRWYRVVATYKGTAIADGPEALGTTLPAGDPDTGDGATGRPVDLTAEEAKDSSFRLAEDRGVLLLWNAPVETGKFDHMGFTVQRKVDDGDWETIEEDTGSDATHYTDTDEPAVGEERAYRVRSRSIQGQSTWSNMAYYPPMTAEGEPEEVGPATGVTTGPFNVGGVIQVSWDAAPNATGYIIYAVNVDELDDANGQVVVEPVNDAAAETFNLGSLNVGDTYDIYVVATGKEMVAWPAAAVQVTAN